ncbi:MAG: type II secretion system protein GspI [Candidatus Muproteobacteria bacterium RBG_16_60_9]|uniref:Type II secretion system protein I n=1 Tax=Candidatus Muproteobacteria bacterium RBG_16_60_9 TaxID=1817755 RepID=A0A1F6VHG1_9PROT|nr:MAG: type II secretion system protein GspI [Candidatus Muproteobacteria bacterium RBG_16_60_9]
MGRCSPLRSPSRQKAKHHRGFTLVEVLVALAVLAIALAAVLRAMGQAIDLSTDLRQRTVALWAAEERATERQLKNDWPALDTTDGTMEFGDREWRWKERVVATPLQELRRVEIEIRAPDSPDVLGRLTVFLRQP